MQKLGIVEPAESAYGGSSPHRYSYINRERNVNTTSIDIPSEDFGGLNWCLKIYLPQMRQSISLIYSAQTLLNVPI